MHHVSASPSIESGDLVWLHLLPPNLCMMVRVVVTSSTLAKAFTSKHCKSNIHTVVWLDSQATYFPADIGAQVRNTHPVINQSTTTIPNVPSPLTLNNLASLNAYGDGGKDVYLASGYSPTDYLSWFAGVKPNSNGATVGATSCAIIVVPKANDILDAFYFYFFAFNQGNQVLSQPELEFGDHVRTDLRTP